VFHTKKHWQSCIISDVDLVTFSRLKIRGVLEENSVDIRQSYLAEIMLRYVGDLLGCSSTFNTGQGEGKDGVTFVNVAQAIVDTIHVLRRIYRTDFAIGYG